MVRATSMWAGSARAIAVAASKGMGWVAELRVTPLAVLLLAMVYLKAQTILDPARESVPVASCKGGAAAALDRPNAPQTPMGSWRAKDFADWIGSEADYTVGKHFDFFRRHCPTLTVDRTAFEAQYCGKHQLEGRAWPPESGVMVLRGALSNRAVDEVRRGLTHPIPYPRRWLCGNSDSETDTPGECELNDASFQSRLPRSWRELNAALSPMKLQLKGRHVAVRVSAQSNMRRLIADAHAAGRLAWIDQATQDLGELSEVTLYELLTHRIHLPVWPGFHDWHVDGDAEDVSASGLVWVMIEKNCSADGVGGRRGDSNLVLVPANAYAVYEERLQALLDGMPPQSSFAVDWHTDEQEYCRYAMLNEISCLVKTAPGDAVAYTSNLWHRTQDALSDREALSCDLDVKVPDGDADDDDDD